MKRSLLFISLLFIASACHAVVTNVQTRPAGSDGYVQYNNGGVFGGESTFTYDDSNNDLSVSSASITFIDGSTATLYMIRWADGTTQTTAAGSGSYIILQDTLQSGATFFVSSATVNDLYVTNINGSSYPPAGSGGGGFWIGTATSALNMGDLYAVYGATIVTASSMSVTGATITINGLTYNFPSSVGTGSRLLQLDYSGGRATVSFPEAIVDGMRTSSTDTVTAAKVFQSSITLPTSTQVQTVDAAGEIMIDTGAYTTQGSSSTLVYYADGRKYYVVATTGPPPNDYIPKYDSTLNQWSVEVDTGSGSGGSGSPGGSDTQLQFNNAGVFDGVGVATFNATSNLLTFSSAVTNVNIASQTFTNVNLVLSGTSKITHADGTVQTSSPPASILLQSSLQTGATAYISSMTVEGQFHVSNVTDNVWIRHTADSAFGPKGATAQIKASESFGSGGTYRIAVSTQPTLPTTQTAGQTELKIRAPTSDNGSVGIWVDGTTVATFLETDTTIGTDLIISNNEKLQFFNGGQYLTFQSTAAPNQAYDIHYTLPDSTGSAGQFLAIAEVHSDHVDLEWATSAGGSGGGFWIDTATSPLDMDGYAMENLPAIVTTNTVTGGAFISTGPVQARDGTFSAGVTGSSAAITNTITAGSVIAATGTVNAKDGIFTAGVTAATGTFSTGLEAPNGTGPTVDETGEFAVDTSSGQVVVSTNGSNVVVLPYDDWEPLVIESPAEGDFPFYFRPLNDITVSSLVCISSAATSATIEVQECDANGANCVAINTAGACTTTNTTLTLTDTAITAGNRVRLKVTAVSGTPGWTSVDLYYRETRK